MEWSALARDVASEQFELAKEDLLILISVVPVVKNSFLEFFQSTYPLLVKCYYCNGAVRSGLC